jgi:hypothetical protein
VAKIRNPFKEPRQLPWLGDRVVGVDEVVDVPDAHLPNYVAGGWIDETPLTATTSKTKATAGKDA